MKCFLRRQFYFFLIALIPSAILLLAGMPAPGKMLKGDLFLNSGLFDQAEGKQCRRDSAKGAIIAFSMDHENPLFESAATNRVHLMLWFKEGIQAGKTYTLPDPEVQVCYWEKGDLLMFHSFHGKGSIHFDEIQEEKGAKGSMDLKLVKPHHNMSNSDYHYMGGKFRLKSRK